MNVLNLRYLLKRCTKKTVVKETFITNLYSHMKNMLKKIINFCLTTCVNSVIILVLIMRTMRGNYEISYSNPIS